MLSSTMSDAHRLKTTPTILLLGISFGVGLVEFVLGEPVGTGALGDNLDLD